MRGDGWEDYLEEQESMDFIKTAQPQWKNLNISDTARRDEFLTIRESMVKLHRMTDNFRGKTVTLVAGCWHFHAAQSEKPKLN